MRATNRWAMALVGAGMLLLLRLPLDTMDWDTPVWWMLWDLYREALVFVIPACLGVLLILVAIVAYDDTPARRRVEPKPIELPQQSANGHLANGKIPSELAGIGGSDPRTAEVKSRGDFCRWHQSAACRWCGR